MSFVQSISQGILRFEKLWLSGKQLFEFARVSPLPNHFPKESSPGQVNIKSRKKQRHYHKYRFPNLFPIVLHCFARDHHLTVAKWLFLRRLHHRSRCSISSSGGPWVEGFVLLEHQDGRQGVSICKYAMQNREDTEYISLEMLKYFAY